jgi:lipopolysaccharide biosynthesis protein
MEERKLCVFVHYSNCLFIPKYVRLFLDELCNYFDEIILIQNKRPLKSKDLGKNSCKIKQIFTRNEGYDMGMFYKALQTVDLNAYSQIACINDSNILFNKLEPLITWKEQNQYDFWGPVDSHQPLKKSDGGDTYHIQSHFMVFNRRAIALLPDFFQGIDLKQIFLEKNKKKLRQMVISKWEIGLTQYFLNHGLSVGSYFKSKVFSEELNLTKPTNLSCSHYFRLIQRGYPLIKKQVTNKRYFLKLLFRPHLKWDKLIMKYGEKEWQLEDLIQEVKAINKLA